MVWLRNGREGRGVELGWTDTLNPNLFLTTPGRREGEKARTEIHPFPSTAVLTQLTPSPFLPSEPTPIRPGSPRNDTETEGQ